MIANDVFISYSTRNADMAMTVRRMLQSHGITCWMAPESIPAGSNYTKEIPSGICYSKLGVLVLSKASLESVWVNQEVSYLLDAGHPIIPFVVEDVFSHPDVKEEPYATVVGSDSLVTRFENDDSWNQLLYTVQKQLAHSVTPRLPSTSDDYLQWGLRDIREDGGMLFDDGRALFYLTKSAELGNAVAMRHLARLVRDIGEAEDAEAWWKKAAENGDIPAQIRQACRLMYKDGTPDRLSLATDMLRNGVQADNPEACCLFGELLLNPENRYFNPSLALEMLRRSLDLGDRHAACILGKVYKEGAYVDEDPELSFRYFMTASEDITEREAHLLLADCYAAGYGTAKDLKRAFEGYGENCYYSDEYREKYADCFYYGYGVEASEEDALDMYRRIALDDDFETIAKSELQLRVLKKRIELGDNESLALIGDYYYSIGDFTNAVACYEKAVEDDDSNASLALGLCYLRGDGVPHDFSKAFNLLAKAYALKNQKAAKYLAECYRYGVGTEKSESKANYFEDISCQPEDGLWSFSYIDND